MGRGGHAGLAEERRGHLAEQPAARPNDGGAARASGRRAAAVMGEETRLRALLR
jgi:hypothetical protein